MTTTKFTLLWDFSLAHYAKPQVAEHCLQLQDSYGVNVNVLLWALWLESQHKLLTGERLQVALAAIAQWDINYVQALRELRRKMKQDFADDLAQVADVRDQIKHAELLAEKQEQQWLADVAQGWSETTSEIAKGKNLSLYLEYSQVPLAVIEQIKRYLI